MTDEQYPPSFSGEELSEIIAKADECYRFVAHEGWKDAYNNLRSAATALLQYTERGTIEPVAEEE